MRDGTPSRAGALRAFSGAGDPERLAIDAEGLPVYAHPGVDAACVANALSEVTHFVRGVAGRAVTNVAF